MISVLTNISALERKNEIGIFKVLGAGKRDVARIFNSETFITGAFSGIIGVGTAKLLSLPVNLQFPRAIIPVINQIQNGGRVYAHESSNFNRPKIKFGKYICDSVCRRFYALSAEEVVKTIYTG